MWQDALRVCKEYVPHKLQQLQDEYDREMTDKSTRYDVILIFFIMEQMQKFILLLFTTIKCHDSSVVFVHN